MRRVVPFLFFGLLLLLALPALAQSNACTSLGSGASSDITGPDGVCRKVTNGRAETLCVTTATTGMWQSFYGAPPSSVTVASCNTPVNGQCNVDTDENLDEAGCVAGTYQFISLGSNGAASVCPTGFRARWTNFRCLGINGGTSTGTCVDYYLYEQAICCGRFEC